METGVSDAMALAGTKTTCDEKVVRLFSHKSILALMLKFCVHEFSGLSVGFIMNHCFVGEPIVLKVSVDQDRMDAEGTPIFPLSAEEIANGGASQANGNAFAWQMNTVDKSIREGEIRYDILFQAMIPGEGVIMLIINVEIQNDGKLDYYPVTRGIYYGGRMISAQKNRVFHHMDFGKIQKVCSLWVCPFSKTKKNSLTRFHISKELIFGDDETPESEYDKLDVIILTTNKDGIKSENDAVRFVSELLEQQVSAEERIKTIEKDFNINFDDDVKEEINTVCNYSDAIEKRAEENLTEQLEKCWVFLSEQGRTDELGRAISDKAFRDQLLKECTANI